MKGGCVMLDDRVYTNLKLMYDEVGTPIKTFIPNMFMRNILMLTKNAIGKGKIVRLPMFDTKEFKGRANRVIDACRLSPLVIQDGSCKNIVDEIALYRGRKYNLSPNECMAKRMVLFADYLLSVSLCYIEVSNGVRVTKYYATRNLNIVKALCPPDVKAGNYAEVLKMYMADINKSVVKVLKLSTDKNGVFKAVQPRGGLVITEGIRITPVCITNVIWNTLCEILKHRAIEFTYTKDNGTVRELTTTFNKALLMQVYDDEEHVDTLLKQSGEHFSRGYVRVPDTGLSKYDDTGIRALNVTRLINMKVINKIDTSYVDVDFDNILPSFIRGCDSYVNDYEALRQIYVGIFKIEPPTKDCAILRIKLQEWAEEYAKKYTSTFLKRLHDFMTSMPLLFMNYTNDVSVVDMSGDFGVL